jgi:acyl-CoA synthetase (AMP-forming)/AMP-acid ligase II/thioesterase domain-containing protein/NAD(P)-dependent dehydrogenase (short-subunit alcohol dehydrogenase family)/acyl carrier protein
MTRAGQRTFLDIEVASKFRQQIALYQKQDSVIDEDAARQWEKELQALPEIDQAVVVIQDIVAKTPLLHLSDLLPNEEFTPRTEPEIFTVESNESVETDDLLHPIVPAIAHGAPLPDEPDMPQTLQEMLRRTVHQAVGERIVYLQVNGSQITQSYRDLLDRAERILAGLRQQGLRPQDKVIFQLELPQDILPAFWGCILGGFIPVIMGVAPTYQEANSAVDKLCNVWKLLEEPLILTNEPLRESIQNLSQWILPEALTVKSIESLGICDPDLDHHPSQTNDIAFFNLTSGSTGMPKCISLTHRNLISRAKGANILNQHNSEDIILNWLPFDHIGSISDWHIRCVYLGCQLIYASKEYILGRPLNWMDLIHQYRITHSWAPNFAYALVNQALKQESSDQPWDLSCVKSLLTAGEAVSSQAVEEFIENLTPYGFRKTAIRPAFGMAEMGSGITYYQPTEEEPLKRHTLGKMNTLTLKNHLRQVLADHVKAPTFIDLGPVISGMSMRIVDSENALVQEGQIGYLQVKGNAVTSGYYKNPEVNQEVFLDDGWFNTGDLGFLSNGHLVVTGRAKETIIVNGANYYTHEIEAVVEEVEGIEVSYTAACAVHAVEDATEKLAIFFNTTLDGNEQLIGLIKMIRQKVVNQIGLNPDFLIPVPKAAIPKTGIGKIQRSQLSKQFESGEFVSVLKQVDILLGNTNTLPDWFYRKVWRPKSCSPTSFNFLTGTTLVFKDSSGLGECLGAGLDSCILVEIGSEFVMLASDRYQIDPRNPAHYRQLLKTFSDNNLQISQVLHLWSYESYREEISNLETLEEVLDLGTYSPLFLIQALAEVQDAEELSVRLLVVASHVQPTSPADIISAEKSPVLGLLKSAAQELPWIRVCHVDLPFGQTQDNSKLLLHELQEDRSEQEVAYRNGQRLVPRLQNIDWKQTPKKPIPFKQRGMYLVSGGLGGIGVEIAQYLLQNYDARLLLLGRTPLPAKETWTSHSMQTDDNIAQQIAAYQAIEQLGGEVRYEVVDICNLEQLQTCVKQATADWKCELEGVIHLAGNAPERMLVDETHNSLTEVLRPKVLGTWTLHQLLKNKPNSVFISFSSLASFFGGAMIGAYSAANTFLDYFSHNQRHGYSLRSYCFSWAMWDGVGMSRHSLARNLLQAKGYRAVSVHQGLSSMLTGLHYDQGQLLIGIEGGNRNIQRYLDKKVSPSQSLVAYFTQKPDVSSIKQIDSISVCDRSGIPIPCKIEQIQTMPLQSNGEIDREQLIAMGQKSTTEQVKPRTELEQQLVKLWQEILGISEVGIYDSFFELGGSSLQAARLFAAIEKQFGKNLPLATLFNAQTIEQLAQLLNESTESTLWSSLVAIQPNGSKPPLYCIHGAGGNILMYRQLIDYLGADQPLYGLQPKGLDGNETPIDRIQEMAELYVQQICDSQPKGPYYLIGLSVGGTIAFEMAQLLHRQGQKVAFLGLIDTLGPGYPKLLPLAPRFVSLLPYIARNFPGKVLSRLMQLGSRKNIKTPQTAIESSSESVYEQQEEQSEELIKHDKTLDNLDVLSRKNKSLKDYLESFSLSIFKFTPWAFIVPRFYLENSHSFPGKLQKVQEANIEAMLTYKPQSYPGNIALFKASEQPPGCYQDRTLGWGDVVDGDIGIYEIPGTHGEWLLYDDKSVRVLGLQLKLHLDKAQRF